MLSDCRKWVKRDLCVMKWVQGMIDTTSGCAPLDRSAREKVLIAWLFQPAIVDGNHVQAWARLAVSVDLRHH